MKSVEDGHASWGNSNKILSHLINIAHMYTTI